MQGRREFLIIFGGSLLLAGCGGSGSDVAPASAPTDEQKKQTEDMKADMLKKAKGGR
jgi:hypothetical protein